MDAAVLFWTDADRRRMRMGELTASNSTRTLTRRAPRPGEAAEPEVAEHAQADPHAGEETDAQQKSRVEREKAQWREEDKRRRSFDEVLRQNLGDTRKLAAQNGIPQLTAMYMAQREMRNVEAEKNQANVDVQTQLGASSAQIQSLVGEARGGGSSWEYRRSVLSRARLAVSDHLAAIHQIQDRYYDKFAEFAGKPDIVSDLNGKMSDIEQRKRFMEEYYTVLQGLASGDQSVGGLDRVAGGAAQVAPEIVKNSSTMRLMARRRRNFWAEVA